MSKAPMLSKPEDGNVERPVYYASKALQDAETRYSNIEKLALTLGCGAGLILTTPDKVAMEYVIHFKFKASNNEVEYEALIESLRLAKHLGVKRIDIFSYSQLVVNQITQIPRAANSHADALARLASAVEDKIGRKIQVELLTAPSTMAAKVCNLQYGDS
ncbi:hypothetical protein COP2_036643 [Malus domestica]